jgi:hypothetical protein
VPHFQNRFAKIGAHLASRILKRDNETVLKNEIKHVRKRNVISKLK